MVQNLKKLNSWLICNLFLIFNKICKNPKLSFKVSIRVSLELNSLFKSIFIKILNNSNSTRNKTGFTKSYYSPDMP